MFGLGFLIGLPIAIIWGVFFWLRKREDNKIKELEESDAWKAEKAANRAIPPIAPIPPKYRLEPSPHGGYYLQEDNKNLGWWTIKGVATKEEADKVIAHIEQDCIYYREEGKKDV